MIDIDNIEAYNVRLKTKENMDVTAVIRTPIMKEGTPTGKYRYRLAGVGSDGTGMSRFVNEADAKEAARQLGKKIETRAAKPRVAKPRATKAQAGARPSGRKSCEDIGRDAEERCLVRRAGPPQMSPVFLEELYPTPEPVFPRRRAPAKKAPARKAPVRRRRR